MHRRTLRGAAAVIVGMFALAVTSGCRSSVSPAQPATAAGGAPVYGAWTTPPQPGTRFAASPAQQAALQPAPQSIPAPMTQAQPRLERYGPSGMPPPPPPPDRSLPVQGAPAYAGATYAAAPAGQPCAPCATETRNVWAVPERCYSGCGLPCAQGISMWHVRPVVGLATFAGDDAAENCIYYGLDFGRTFCGCWGLDVYYRYNSGRFTREPTPGITFKDGGAFHHVGVKFTYDWNFGSSPFSAFGGIGGGYFWTEDYLNDDSGPELFLEAGVAWHLGRNWAIRGGVNAHVMDTDVTRRNPADDGKSRILWVIAPVIELEARF